jgi:hypothetical protein
LKKLARIPEEYFDVIPIGKQLFSPLYQFENGLRLAVHKFLSTCYTADWWEVSLKTRLPTIYKYAEEQKRRRDLMPWIGDSAEIEVLPIHLITLGQLEEIVKEYKSDCIPDLFPTMEFFLGHMECIKRVRNLFSHMVPCLTQEDTELARGEIRALTSHINTKL